MVENYSFKSSADLLKRSFQGASLKHAILPSYNISNGDKASVLFNEAEKYQIESMVWGVKNSQNSDALRLTSARSEGIFSQSTFRFAVRTRRCLIPMDSFYSRKRQESEWLNFRVCPPDERIIFAAGVWNQDKEGKSFSILSTKANRDVINLGDRMPMMIFERKDMEKWLDPNLPLKDVMELITIPESRNLKFYRVGDLLSQGINSARLHETEEESLTLFDV